MVDVPAATGTPIMFGSTDVGWETLAVAVAISGSADGGRVLGVVAPVLILVRLAVVSIGTVVGTANGGVVIVPVAWAEVVAAALGGPDAVCIHPLGGMQSAEPQRWCLRFWLHSSRSELQLWKELVW